MKSIVPASRSMARPATLRKLKQLLKTVAQSFEKDNDAKN
jgi:hypothetical protein